jgi:hypothetical protein
MYGVHVSFSGGKVLESLPQKFEFFTNSLDAPQFGYFNSAITSFVALPFQ